MFTKPFTQISKHDANIAGGKGASLGEMTQAGIPVPSGFVVLADAFEQFLKETDLNVEIDSILHTVNHQEMHTVEHASERIQKLILEAKMPEDIANEIKSEFEKLGAEFVAVRSSATAEDSASAAWAGQLDSFLNTTKETLLENVQKCFASLFTPRAVFYRFEKGLHDQKISVAVVVQKMVDSEKSGIAFSVHPVTEDRNQLIIEAGFGLGEAIVSGQVTPDSYVVEKDRIISGKENVKEENGVQKMHAVITQTEFITPREREYALAPVYWNSLAQTSEEIKKLYGVAIDAHRLLFRKGHMRLAINKAEWDRVSSFVAGQILEKESYFVAIKNKTFEAKKKIEKLIHRLEDIDFAQCSFPKLVSEARNIQEAFMSYDTASVYAWFTAGDEVKRLAGEHLGIASEELDIISLPSAPTIVTQMEEDILVAASQGDTSPEKLDSLASRYFWVPFGYDGPTTWDAGHFREMIQKKIDGRNAAKELEIFHERRKSMAARAEEIQKEYQFGEKELHYIEVLRAIALWTDERKQLHFRLCSKYDGILKELGRRFGFQREELKYLFTEELEKLEKDADTLRETAQWRMQNEFMTIGEKGMARVASDEEMREIKLVAFPEIVYESIDTLRGVVACAGPSAKYRARVKVLHSPKEVSKIEPGEFLVATMTSPNFLIGMSRALGFITDEGGVTSHAAITARETNKPCVIGTKNATKVLKDGDLVEVDTALGTVRILERASDAWYDKSLDWAHYLTRPFTLFGASLWRGWYDSDVIFNLFGVQMKNALFVEQAAGVARNYRIINELAHYGEGMKTFLEKDEKRARLLLDEAAALNAEAEKYLSREKEFGNLSSAVDFLMNLALRATILPFWVLHFSTAIKYHDEALPELAEKLRGVSHYSDFVSKIVTPLAEKILEKNGEDKKYLSLITLSELLSGKMSSLAQRKKEAENGKRFLYEVFDGKEKVSYVDNVPSILADLEHVPVFSGEIHGQAAHKGKVSGIARIVYGIDKNTVFNKGDILISINSNPSLMPLLEKCAGIVTDEGGVMCHAAIMAREFGKPCIIGTKIATQVLHDGDLVEVDADNGIVKIIN